MPLQILHLEDSPADAELIRYELEKVFERCQIILVSDKESYKRMLKTETYQLILSDYNVPNIRGLESIEMAKQHGLDVPFIYVSGAIGEEGAVEMLKYGASDYVLKSKLEKLHIAVTRSLKYFSDRFLVEEKERKLREQELEYRYLIERINEGFIKVNQEGEIVIANPAACHLFGYTHEELNGKNAHQTLNILLDDVKPQKLKSDGYGTELVLERKDGDKFWAHLSISMQINEEGESTGTAIIIRDITNQKLIEVWREIISRIARELSASENSLSRLFQKLHKELGQHMPHSNFFALLRNTNDEVRLIYQRDTIQQVSTPRTRPDDIGLSSYILRNKEPLWLKGSQIESFEENHNIKIQGVKPKSIIIAPIVADETAIGVIGCIDYEDPNAFNEFHFSILTYVGQNVGIFIDKVEAEQNKNKILNLSEDLICIVSDDGLLRYTNPAFHKHLGFKRNELINKHVETLISKRDITLRNQFRRMLQTEKKRFKFDSKIITKTGESRYISWTAMSHEKDKSFYCIGRDFTEKRAIQQRIEESENRYRGLFQRMNEGLIRSNDAGTILTVNPGLCKMLGYSENELIGKIGYEMLHEPQIAVRLRQKIKYRKEGKAGLYETKFIHKNGKTVWAQISSTPDYDEKGEFTGVMSIVLDITERKKAENEAMAMKEAFTRELEREVSERTVELENARKELATSLKKEQELGRLKSRFVSTASHQFRTPLSVIQSSIGILAMQMDSKNDSFNPGEFKEKFEKIYGRIKEQIQRMTDLMNDVLILGKINEGNIALRMISQPIVPVCQDILDNYTNISQQNRIELQVKGEPRELEFDKQLLEHAMSNLISNAIKYSPEDKTPLVEINFRNDSTEIKVEDEGIGIPEEELQHLFEPFYRASNVKEYSGTGLGTAIAKEYIELIGGTISVRSQLGEGTEFTIRLNN